MLRADGGPQSARRRGAQKRVDRRQIAQIFGVDGRVNVLHKHILTEFIKNGGIKSSLAVFFKQRKFPSSQISKGKSQKMAIVGNKLYRQAETKKEEAAEIDRQILRLEDDIRRLKIEFDIYFNGAAKRPPLEMRARLEANLKRLSDDRNLTYAQRYHFNSLISRFNSYRELWRRNLKKKGEELI
jgi:hypothetical protein